MTSLEGLTAYLAELTKKHRALDEKIIELEKKPLCRSRSKNFKNTKVVLQGRTISNTE